MHPPSKASKSPSRGEAKSRRRELDAAGLALRQEVVSTEYPRRSRGAAATRPYSSFFFPTKLGFCRFLQRLFARYAVYMKDGDRFLMCSTEW